MSEVSATTADPTARADNRVVVSANDPLVVLTRT